MNIDISIGKESMTIDIEDPHRFNVSRAARNVVDFGKGSGVDLSPFKIDILLSKMIRGVAGCEGGCPSNAKDFVGEGFGAFTLSYIEGGILSAVHPLENGNSLSIKVFPDFE